MNASSLPLVRRTGAGVVLGALVVTMLVAALIHAFGKPDGSVAGEFATEGVAAVLGYAVAFGLAPWRPARSTSPRTAAERTAAVLAVLGALLVPICFWNPMPATFAIAAVLLLRWGAERPGRSVPALTRGTQLLAAAVIGVQLVWLVVHGVTAVAG
jgi:hypothetical protein